MSENNASPEAAFAAIARNFCAWCEAPSLGPTKAVSAARWLSTLNAAALALPNVGPENADGGPELPETALAKARSNLAHFNGWYYREFFDPDPASDEEPCMGDIGDDLIDIYKDIKAGGVLYDSGATAKALWHWSFLHRIHWGRHAVGAVFALHCLAISKQ
jgi:hypothetical protein